MSHVHTPLIDGLVKLQGMFPMKMKKKEYTAYINENPILEVAYNDKKNVTKTSVAQALSNAREQEDAPEVFADDYKELKGVFELTSKYDESLKIIKEMDKDLDEKARTRYDTLGKEEIMKLLVDRKWYNAITNGINSLYEAISRKITERLVELSKRYDDTYMSIDAKILETEKSVSKMLSDLVGEQMDVEGIAELSKLLGGV